MFAQRVRKAYIIRNARLDPDWATVERSTLTIAGHAISALIETQGIGDLYRLYLLAQKDGLDFNLAYIGADFTAEHQEDFDPRTCARCSIMATGWGGRVTRAQDSPGSDGGQDPELHPRHEKAELRTRLGEPVLRIRLATDPARGKATLFVLALAASAAGCGRKRSNPALTRTFPSASIWPRVAVPLGQGALGVGHEKKGA